jgi:ATP-dependent DNA ligase
LPELNEISWPEGEWIFDAEVVASDLTYESTSERMQRSKGTDELPHTMDFWVFDVIVADGEYIGDQPFEERVGKLFTALPMDDRIKIVNAFEDVEEAREEALENGFEGLILKERDHTVEFGKRSTSWVKDKFTTETVDLRISGFEEGTGRNAGKLGAVEVETEDGHKLGKVGTGFSDTEREKIWRNKMAYKDEIIEVKFDVDEGYEDGLRFPAFVRFRSEKAEANDLERVENISEVEG